MKRRLLVFGGLGVAVTIAITAWVWRPASNAPAKMPMASSSKPALTVTTATVQTATWPKRLEAHGSVAAWQEAVIGAEVGGLRTTEVLVNVGDRVRRGHLLARLQSDTVNAELLQTQAAIAEVEATLAEAKATAGRARQLQEAGFISSQQYGQSATAEVTARARLTSLKARLAADEIRLAQTRILAPDEGVISSRTASVGAVLQPGQELFRLIRGGRLEWRAEVPAADLAFVKAGMAARLVAAGGATAEGRVRMIGPTVDPQTRSGLVYVDLPAPGEIKAGMFARGEFDLGQAAGMSLPQSAVLLRDGFSYVFLVSADSRVTMKKVETGRRIGERIELREALPADARVVASGGGFLGDGDTVRVVDAVVAPVDAAAAPEANRNR